MARLLLKNARIVDGTNAPAFDGDVLIEDERIAEVGDAQLTPDEVVDVGGAVVAPGFIDVHSHGDFGLLSDGETRPKTLQGVTTEVVCNCGLGLFPANGAVEAYYEMLGPMIFGEEGGRCLPHLQAFRGAAHKRGISVNAACLVPHGNVRVAAMGVEEREPSEAELGHMKELVEEGMDQGAFGLSSGLVYPPGSYAATDELIELARVVQPFGGMYATHMRDEGTQVVEALEEAIFIGQEAGVPVQISHHKVAGRFNWGKTKRTLARIEEAQANGQDVTSDVYPYTAGSTVLSTIFIPQWAFEGGLPQLMVRLQDPEARERIVETGKERTLQMAKLPGVWDRLVPKRLLLPLIMREIAKVIVLSSVPVQSHLEGMSLWEIARQRRQPLYDALMDLLVEENTAVAAIAFVMAEEDVQRVMTHPTTMFGTDGFDQRHGKPHPRTFGTYPRVLQHYTREEGVLGLETAIHKMTGMVARKLGLRDRGVLEPGAHADVVVFDPATVEDHATYAEPRRHPTGFKHLFVNGRWTVRHGRHTGARAGRVLSSRPR
ncbi:MAG: amidohydrolase family protein [Sandaracinaceae bacterium]